MLTLHRNEDEKGEKFYFQIKYESGYYLIVRDLIPSVDGFVYATLFYDSASKESNEQNGGVILVNLSRAVWMRPLVKSEAQKVMNNMIAAWKNQELLAKAREEALQAQTVVLKREGKKEDWEG